MGTNYYANSKPCETCGRADHGGEVHIGKSSSGWVFLLKTYKDLGIETLSDWIAYLADKEIVDEYGEKHSLGYLVEQIAQRSHPRGLLRGSDTDRSLRRGEGTWDYSKEWFS